MNLSKSTSQNKRAAVLQLPPLVFSLFTVAFLLDRYCQLFGGGGGDIEFEPTPNLP